MKKFILICFLMIGCSTPKGDFVITVFDDEGNVIRQVETKKYKPSIEGIKVGDEVITGSFQINKK